MARGSKIIISSNPKGQFLSGIAGDTSKPGTIMQVKAATALIGSQFTWIAAASGTDGKRVLFAVMLEDNKNGFGTGQSAVVGQQIELYCPISGEDINVLVGEVAGTANTYAIGDRLEVDAEDGILVPEAVGTQCPAIMMEVLTQVAGSTLAWVQKT